MAYTDDRAAIVAKLTALQTEHPEWPYLQRKDVYDVFDTVLDALDAIDVRVAALEGES
jgi:hypothetical protein